jgi:Ankyrin repeats (3 copies)
MPPKPETQFIRACSSGKSDVVRGLLQSGLASETRDNFGLTGLIWAARKGHIEVAKILLAFGADLEARDRTGRTALHHAVAFNRHDFVEFIADRGAFLNPVDLHGWTPLDLAASGGQVVRVLAQLGAERRKSEEPLEIRAGLNRFSSGGAVGGPDLPVEVERIHIQLNTLLRRWVGKYSPAVEGFAFLLYVDASLARYTKQLKLCGPQKARRSGRWLSVKIGVPESWWRGEEAKYKTHLTDSIEEGLKSMIALLQRNKHQVNAQRLLADWATIKQEFLETPAPPFAAEKQRAQITAAVNHAIGAGVRRKRVR